MSRRLSSVLAMGVATLLVSWFACRPSPGADQSRPARSGSGGSQAAQAREVVGPARVVDGDTLVIRDVRIRLLGVDAPELKQECDAAGGAAWPAGAVSRDALRLRVGSSPVRCAVDGRDKYDRQLASCTVDGEDLGSFLVRAGLAYAYKFYSPRYLPEQTQAERAGRGVWARRCERPWRWRKRKRAGKGRSPRSRVLQPPDPACAIKGNVSRGGERIYHVPGSPGYASTVINEARGERWLCSEVEAQAAGFRPPR